MTTGPESDNFDQSGESAAVQNVEADEATSGLTAEDSWALFWDSQAEPINAMPDWQEVYVYAEKCARNSKALRSDLDDVVQYVVKALYTKDLGIRHWKAYIRTMVSNRVIDLYRKRKAENNSWDGIPEPGAQAWHTVRTIFATPISTVKPQDLSLELAANSVLAHVIGEIPEHHRELFIDYLEGVAPEQLAEIYGYSSARSVSQTISRIKRNLRERFDSEQALFGEFN
jgi:RNA polymerase sigma factor (sigma-70 family)